MRQEQIDRIESLIEAHASQCIRERNWGGTWLKDRFRKSAHENIDTLRAWREEIAPDLYDRSQIGHGRA